MFEFIMNSLIMLHRYLWLYSDSEAFTNVFGSELISDLMGNLVLNLSGMYDLYIEGKNPFPFITVKPKTFKCLLKMFVLAVVFFGS